SRQGRSRPEQRPMACRRSAAVRCLWAALLLHLAAEAASRPPAVVAGPVSRAEDARLFHIYYGQGFKVLKNAWDGKSYLLMQSTSKMASGTRYCTGRIKSFVVPLANYSLDTAASPVSFFELLGVLENLKGITSAQVASQCVLQAYASGNVQLVNGTDAGKLSQFRAHFVSTDQDRGCNFAAYVPSEEDTPLQIKTNYLCLSKAAAALSTRFKPVVAWVEFTEYVKDAGAEIVDATITDKRFKVSDPEDMDSLHAILCTVDVVIDQTYASDPGEYKLSTFLDNIDVGRDSCFSFITNQSIWRFDKRIGNSKTLDWSDGAISQPQLVLADLIEAFFPTGNYTTIYFRNLAKEEGVTEIVPEMCTRSISTPMEPTILPCQ
uniref:Fe/B12 periplasmic-binding domain-containing protein n=1 Tax=Aegilops tauschii subsp. strangulata TaxID=200361 RepID=A0A453J6F6_AEGTS